MSTSSNQSRGLNRRINSLQSERRHSQGLYQSRTRVTHSDAYMYALRVAYLSYLLQPRSKRLQHVPAAPSGPQHHPQRSSTSVNDLMKDFSLVRDSKSTRFPHGFMSDFEKRLSGVVTGRERRPEYADAVVRRTFAIFYTAFTEAGFRRRMEKDRRVEDLVLIFFSSATKELAKGKSPSDDGWKLMVDRHGALFVRLISLTLREHDRDKPELTTRLATLEKKLLKHDQDLAEASQRQKASGTGTVQVEQEVPLSYEVKDMPLVQSVAKIFGLTHTQIQSDISSNKDVWTEKAALADLKTYQNLLNLNSPKTLRKEDFESEDAYETWRKAERPDLSQMILAIIQSSPELAKSSPGGNLPHFKSPPSAINSDMSRVSSNNSDRNSYVIDQTLDLSHQLSNGSGTENGKGEEATFTFVPSDPRAYYKFLVGQALAHDIADQNLQASEATSNSPAMKLLSKQSTEILNEVALRWRIPASSRLILLMDVIKEKFLQREIDLDTLDTAFSFVKEPIVESKKPAGNSDHSSLPSLPPYFDRSKWPLLDRQLNRQILSSLDDALLRDLYDIMQSSYGVKPPSIGPVMTILETHIYDDPFFEKEPEDLDRFSQELHNGMHTRATDMYGDLVSDHIPKTAQDWEFYNVMQLGKAVLKLCERIQKRYRKNPEIMGINPFSILVEAIMPLYANDAAYFVRIIMEQRADEIPVEDGFALYKDLTDVRRIHSQAIQSNPFPFNIEEQLAPFVYRWIEMTDKSMLGWVDRAIKEDNFKVRTMSPDQIPADDERHSTSIIDIFRSFNQSVDQIVQLEWDNDLQYAKFMTSLAKTVGAGLARYCDTVEAKFAREMDRLTPEQEAAADQTRQAKWMQLAKDAWNTREKIEPFQFFPESFVKLNNIEFAVDHLDRLQTTVNVDGCADVIRKNMPPVAQRQRQINKYVFTIKIVEAEDLKPCDVNGLSDPYVVLGDEYQKRLAKTRIIYGNLNPRWEETVDITTTGPLNIIATIWDWDVLGDHDCVGRTSIKLDPSHFSDFMPREYWLDLDTQGRLLLRVNMEGERDDIVFYYGKAFRTLKRAERDMTRMITDKLSAYINHCLSRGGLRNLLNKGISMQTVSNLFQRAQRLQPTVQTGPTPAEITNALRPLFQYFDDNFAIMKQTLTDPAMVMVMARLWKEVLTTIEGLLVPPLSDKPSQQRQLTQQEVDIVFKWLELLFQFFNALDEETGMSDGIPVDVLKSPKYHEIQSLNFFYFEPTETLIRTSERMASASASRQQQQRNRLSAPGALATNNVPGGPSFGGAASLAALPSTRRTKSIMVSRNIGTMRKAKEEKRREAQAEPNDDMILRILRMRPEAAHFLRERSRQKERLAAAAAAELIVRQSLTAGGVGGASRMQGTLPRR